MLTAKEATNHAETVQEWTTLSSKMVFDHPWYRLRQDTVALPNGQIIDDYFVSLRPDIATVLPITTDGHIVFVRQYRHGIGKILLELPAGTFDLGEEPLAVAQRELAEETGYVAEQWSEIATFYNNPVKQNNRIHLFKAQGAQRLRQQQLDATEDIEVVLKPITAVPDLIATGEICVAGSLTALLLGLGEAFK
ncbi:MAG: NUDIX hydrolase [Phormidesmis sp. RL_2_1]|nr:NUDIX hydrolase [Phormidesmis sp. RL_2_1]